MPDKRRIEKRNFPEDIPAQAKSIVEKVINDCHKTYRRAHPTQGEILTRDCEEGIQDYLRDQHGGFFVVLPFNDHLEVCETDSTRFRNWMAKRYRARYGSPPNNEAIKQARIQVEARCEESTQVELFNRVGWHNGAIYYDLTTSDWRGVRITETGWRIVHLPPIFRRYQHQAQQVMPDDGGDPKEILRFCNIQKDDECLFLVTIASFLIPNIPHVIPNQNGEQGSGKSNNSRKIKGLGDPSKVTLMSIPKDLEQAQMTADKHWINTFDNISKIPEWFSDFLCRAVTGEGDMKRSLYTNNEEFIRAYRRCFVLNGIGVTAWRPDLLDRSIIFEIPVLTQTRPEHLIEKEWNIALPGILGGFFTAISKAMCTIHTITGHEKFRMADFAQWGAALAEAMGFSQDEFFKKYQESVNRKWAETVDENALACKIIEVIEANSGLWQGTAVDFLNQIGPLPQNKDFPQNAKLLSSEIIRLAPVMRTVGIDISRKDKRESGTGRKIFVMQRL